MVLAYQLGGPGSNPARIIYAMHLFISFFVMDFVHKNAHDNFGTCGSVGQDLTIAISNLITVQFYATLNKIHSLNLSQIKLHNPDFSSTI